MARTALAAQQVTDSGLNATYSAANVDGHSIPGDGDGILHVKNGSGSSINVTIQTPGNVGGNAVADRVVAVPAGGERFIGPFDATAYNRAIGDTDGGKVYVDFSAVTTVTVALLAV